MALPIRLPNIGPRTRKVLSGFGLFFLAIITFVFAFQMVFPYDTARQRIEEMAASKVDLQIESVKRSWIPGRFFLENVRLKMRPSAADLEKAQAVTDPKERERAIAQLYSTIDVDEIMVDIGLVGFIKGTASINFIAKIDDGRIKGTIAVSKGETVVHITGSDVPSERLPMREVLSNLPMSGDVNFDFDLELPNEKLKTGKTGPDWTKATGAAELECDNGCVIGDGKSKLKLKAKNSRSQAFAGEGTDFGKVNVQSLVAKVDLKDGKMEITKFETRSTDIELFLDFAMTLQQNLDQSTIAGCVRFKGTEALRKREPKTYDQILLTGAARSPDGLDNIKLEGTFKEVRKLAKLCGPGAKSNGDSDSGSDHVPSGRPTMTVHPDEPTPSPATPTNPPLIPSRNLQPPGPPPPVPTTIDAGVPTAPTGAHPGSGSGSGSGSAEAAPEGSGSAAPQPPG